jgi:S1-C subfamily serine protease
MAWFAPAFLLVVLASLAHAAPRAAEPRLHPGAVSPEPSYIGRVKPSIVGLHVRADAHAVSSARLGARRFASGVIFDARGYVLTVSYAVLDAVGVEARLRDGSTVGARLVGIDLDSGLGVVKLDGPGPWPAVALGESRELQAGTLTATIGTDEDNDLVWVSGALQSVRRFASYWEYMLDRALLVAPASPSWGGSPVVDVTGAVVGIASLRLGAPPHINLAIPIEVFTPVKDELIATGRLASRRARPWLGIYTQATEAGVVVDDFSPIGPARDAGFRRGDRIVGVNGVRVASQEEFYAQLWRGQAGDVIQVTVLRDERTHVIPVRSIDRSRLLTPIRD